MATVVKQKNSKYWYIVIYINKKQKWICSNTTEKHKAERMAIMYEKLKQEKNIIANHNELVSIITGSQDHLQTGIALAEHFPANFRGCIKGRRVADFIAFQKWPPFPFTINGGRGRIH